MDTYLLLALITGGLLIAYSLFLYIFPSRRLNLLLKAGSDALNVLNLLFVYLYTNNALVVVGMAMNVICMIREILFSFRNNYKTLNNIGWPIGFSIVFALSLIFTYKTPLSLLPPIGSVISTMCFYAKNPKLIKIGGALSSVFYIVYYSILIPSTDVLTLSSLLCSAAGFISSIIGLIIIMVRNHRFASDVFPDGTPINKWFHDEEETNRYKKKYFLKKYIKDKNAINTQKIQQLIDEISNSGGGVLIVSKGTYLTGALFIKPGVDLFISSSGILKGSDNIDDYPICKTRIEGVSQDYYPALINVIGVDDFILSGKGVVDGSGEKFWKAFWKRREEKPDCTNLEVHRPRLFYAEKSKNMFIKGITFKDSGFWTSHFYKCDYLKIIKCQFIAPKEPIPAPSSDGIDIDVCHDVLIKHCYFEVNDDAVALKGGKGLNAELDSDNGSNERILVEDCKYGFCHSVLTCGSESIHNKNILLRNVKAYGAAQLLHLKMRPDTNQRYEDILISNIKGQIANDFVNISPWIQFLNLKGKETRILSYISNIQIKNSKCSCGKFYHVIESDYYQIQNLCFDNLTIKTNNVGPYYNKHSFLNISNVSIVKEK